MEIDLNSDLGEGAGHDAAILPLVTSANICCGAHAGDETVIRVALALAKKHGVVVGAHPGYLDRDHFGRRELELEESAIFDLCLRQVRLLQSWGLDEGMTIRYLKPHGALYNQACRDDSVARPVVEAAVTLGLPILALPESRLEFLSRGRIPFLREGFADRRYRANGSLVPRSEAAAMVTDPEEAVAQALRLIEESRIDSLCVHGDYPEAVVFLQGLRALAQKSNLRLRAFA